LVNKKRYAKTPCVPSPLRGKGQDEGVLPHRICSESEPPHPTLSPLGRESRTPSFMLDRQ
jgi:hypothetical protein